MRALWAQIRADGPALTLLAVVVAAACLLTSLVPRLTTTMEQAALRAAASAAPVTEREIRVLWGGWVTDDGIPSMSPAGPLDRVSPTELSAATERITAGFRQPLRTVTRPGYFTITTPALCAAPIKLPTACADRFQWSRYPEGLELFVQGNSALAEVAVWPVGHAPTANVGEAVIEIPTPDGRGVEAMTVPNVETGISTQAGADYGITVGDQFVVYGGGEVREDEPRILTVTGLFEPAPGFEDAWTAARPAQSFRFGTGTNSDQILAEQAIAMVQPEVAGLFSQRRLSDAVWRFPVDVAAVPSTQVTSLAGAIAAAGNERVLASPRGGPGGLGGNISWPMTFISGPATLLAAYQEQVSTFRVLAVVVYLGLATITAAVLVMAAVQLQNRRTQATELARARGASLAQVWAVTLPPAAAAILVGAGLGWLVGALIAGWASGPPFALWLGIGVAGFALLAVAIATAVGYRNAIRANKPPRHPAWRLTVELAVVLIAALAAVLLRRRGLAMAGAALGVDPLLAAVPVLLALATAVLALRLSPLPTALAARAARSGRGAPLFVGLASARGGGGFSTGATLVVLVIAVTFCVFVAAVANTIGVGQQRTSWAGAGADLVVKAAAAGTGTPAPQPDTGQGAFTDRAAQASETPGVLAVVRAFYSDLGQYRMTGGTQSWEFSVLAVDSAAYQTARAVRAALPGGVGADDDNAALSVLGDSAPATAPTPAFGLAAEPTTAAEAAAPLPIGWPGQLDIPGVAAAIPLQIDASSPAVPSALPTLLAPEATVLPLLLLDRATLGEIAPNTLLIFTDDDATARSLATTLEVTGDVTTALRADLLAEIQQSPLVVGTRELVTLAIVASGVLGMLAVALGLLAGAPNRARSLAVLRTLGMGAGAARLMLVAELLPLVIVALATGIGVGLALLPLLGSPLDLRPYVGSAQAPRLAAAPAQVLVIVVATALVVAAAVVCSVMLDGRRQPGSALRGGAK